VTYCEGVTRRPGRPGRKVERAPVYQITGARRGVRDDVDSRTKRYLFSMGIRTVCFVAAVLTQGWLRWVLIFLTVVACNLLGDRLQQRLDPAEASRR